MKGVREEIPFCCFGLSSGKEKNARSTIQSQFRCGNCARPDFVGHSTVRKQYQFCQPAKRVSTEFRNSPKSSVQQCLPMMGNQEKLNCLKIYPWQVWKSTISSQKATKKLFPLSHAFWCDAGVQKHQNRENLRENLTVLRRKYLKHQSRAKAKYKF